MKELVVQPEHLSILHRDLFRAMVEIHEREEEINRATLFEKLGANYLAQMNIGEMMEAVPSVRSFKFHEELVLRYWKNHQVREKTKKFLEDTGEVVGEDQVTSFLTEMKALDRLSTKRLITGYEDYDLLTNGHGKGQFIIIAARPSVGKTDFALNIAAGHTAVGRFRSIYRGGRKGSVWTLIFFGDDKGSVFAKDGGSRGEDPFTKA